MTDSQLEILKTHFIGKKLYGVEDELRRTVEKAGYSLNLQDPEINHSNIDHDTKRVNVMIVNGNISKITVG